MSVLFLKKPEVIQPSGPEQGQINYGNTLTKKLVFLASGQSRVNLVTRQPGTVTGGKFTKGAGKYGTARTFSIATASRDRYPTTGFTGDATLFLVGGLRNADFTQQPVLTLTDGFTSRLSLGEWEDGNGILFLAEPVGGTTAITLHGGLGANIYVGVVRQDVLSLYKNGTLISSVGVSPTSDWSDLTYVDVGSVAFANNPGADVYMAGVVQRAWSDAEVKAFTLNPWQLFSSRQALWTGDAPSFFNVSSLESFSATDSPNAALTLAADIAESITITAIESAVNSVTRPSSDVTTTGWTATPGPDLFDMIDEVTASDTDFITSPDLTSGASTTIHGLTQSLAVGTYTVRFRSEKATAPTRSVRIHLMDGTSAIVGSSGWQAVTASYALYEVSITTSALATRVGIEAQ